MSGHPGRQGNRTRGRQGSGKRRQVARATSVWEIPLSDLCDDTIEGEPEPGDELPPEELDDEDVDDSAEAISAEWWLDAPVTVRPPFAHLKILRTGPDRFLPIVQGLGSALAPEYEGSVDELAVALHHIGLAIAREYHHELLEDRMGPEVLGWLVQSDLATDLAGSGRKAKTNAPRISKLLGSEWVELPTGDVLPARAFFRPDKLKGVKKPDRAAAELLLLARNPDCTVAALAEEQLRQRGYDDGFRARDPEAYKRKKASTARRLGRWRVDIADFVASGRSEPRLFLWEAGVRDTLELTEAVRVLIARHGTGAL